MRVFRFSFLAGFAALVGRACRVINAIFPEFVDARANVFRFDTNVLNLSYALHITRVQCEFVVAGFGVVLLLSVHTAQAVANS